MTVKEFALPDLGEGLTESEVVAWRVAVGDTVELNQIIAEVETAKALVEVPSPFAGVVRELHAEPGETLEVGAPLMSFDVEVSSDAGQDAEPAHSDDSRVDETVAVGVAQTSGTRPVVKNEGGRPRVTGAAGIGSGQGTQQGEGDDGSGGASAQVHADAASETIVEPEEERHAVLVGRGPRAQSARRPQRKTRSGRLQEPVPWERPAGVGGATEAAEGDEPLGAVRLEPTAEPDGAGERRFPATGVRRRTAEAMVRSAAVPQVTEFLTVDVTKSIRLLDRLAATPEFRGKRVTVLTLAAKALCLALAATPEANMRWDDSTGEIVAPAAVNLGIAVATDRGLVVPNIRKAQALRMPELADAISALVERARSGRSAPADFMGGTVTITNVGVFGVDAGTPLLNPGETAILAMGAVVRRPWAHKDAVRLRQVMTLSLTFDHRVIDGEQGSRLLRDLGRMLADPAAAVALA
jgi:pyruvate dehydrogenase E2 component (dihydrolipoamide acetyltransferase)